MSQKVNQPASALDVLMLQIKSATLPEFVSLNQMCKNVAGVLTSTEKTRTILSAFGFTFGKKPEFDSFVNQLKSATFKRHANLEVLTIKTEKDVTTGKDVQVRVRSLVPAIWYDEKHATSVRAAGVTLSELLDPETGGRHCKTKVFHLPKYETQEISYKDADGKTQKKNLRVLVGYDEETRELYAYARPVWNVEHVLAGLREMLFEIDQQTTKSAQLVREFQNAAKK